MALTLLGSENIVVGGGAGSTALIIPSGTKAIICIGASALLTGTVNLWDADPDIGGVAFTRSLDDRVAFAANISSRTDDTLDWDCGFGEAVVYYIGGLGPALHEETSASGGEHTCAAPTNGGNVFGCWVSRGYGADNLNTFYDYKDLDGTAGAGVIIVGHADVGGADEAVQAGHNGAFFQHPVYAQFFIYESAVPPTVEPGRLGEDVAFREGLAITAPTDGTVFLTRLGERIRWRPGLRVTSTAQRQVALVGGGLETPEMTTGGTEGQVLTQHAKSPPTWEDATDDSLHIDTSVSGSHEIDYADGATHDLTLTGDATFTLAGAVTGNATDLRIVLRQDGAGDRTVTWPESVEWAGGAAPTLQTDADAVDTIGLLTVDDGVTWFGYHAMGGGTTIDPATTVESETTWGITPAVGTDTEYARQDHTHGTPPEPSAGGGGIGPLMLASDHAVPIEFDDILQASDGSDFLYASEP